MCLIPNVVIPKKFRVSEFVKYIGPQCLITNLKVYCNKMVGMVHNENLLLIHFFQDNFNKVTLNIEIKRWKNLVDAFIKQYKFNIDIAPSRVSLQVMKIGNKEFIREYAQRWHEVVAQINPPLLKKEMVNMFINTFKTPYFKYLVVSATQCFNDLMIVTKRIEQANKVGKIKGPTMNSKFMMKDKSQNNSQIENLNLVLSDLITSPII